jgi:peptide/nickel transport system permease protein
MSATTVRGPIGSALGLVRRRRGRPPVIVLASFVIVGLVVVCAVFGSLIAPDDPNAQDLLVGLAGPTGGHLFGTDDLGRDVLSRTILGARSALIGPTIVALGSAVVGNLLGLFAGYRGGRVDAAIMRWVDLMYALPPLLVSIVVVGVLGGGYFLAVAVLLVLSIPYDTRLVRGVAAEQRVLPYVEAARTLGVSDRRVMLRHILPNVLPISMANAFLNFAFTLVALSALSFLGLGVGPGTPDWGRMLAESRTLLFDNAGTALAPCLAMVSLAVSMNLIGDWLYERFSDRGRLR